jgi:hypothetical protein
MGNFNAKIRAHNTGYDDIMGSHGLGQINEWLVDWLFTVLRPVQEFLTYMETSPLPVKMCKIYAYARRSGPLSREASYCATPTVTWDLGFSGLIWRIHQFSRLLWHARGCGVLILPWILASCRWEQRTFCRPVAVHLLPASDWRKHLPMQVHPQGNLQIPRPCHGEPDWPHLHQSKIPEIVTGCASDERCWCVSSDHHLQVTAMIFRLMRYNNDNPRKKFNVGLLRSKETQAAFKTSLSNRFQDNTRADRRQGDGHRDTVRTQHATLARYTWRDSGKDEDSIQVVLFRYHQENREKEREEIYTELEPNKTSPYKWKILGRDVKS